MLDWFTSPISFWRRPARMGRNGHEVWLRDRRWGSFVESLISKLEDGEERTASKAFGKWIKRHLPHAFLLPEDADKAGMRAWLEANATDLWTAGEFPQFIRGTFLFIRDPDDAVGFRLRFPAIYYDTNDDEIDLIRVTLRIMSRMNHLQSGLSLMNGRGEL